MSVPAELAPVTGERLSLLRSLGYGELMHGSGVPFLSHLIGTRRVLAEWGSRPALCDAGLFHSVYGTEYFQPEHPATQDRIRAVVGDEAERLAWLWCNIERHTLRSRHRTVRLRQDRATIRLSAVEVSDLATLWAADVVERFGRLSEEQRAREGGILAVVPRASDPARRAVDAIRRDLPPLGVRRRIGQWLPPR